MNDPRAARRVRVTGPRTGRPRPVSVASQIDAQTTVGELYMRTLIRSQLRLAGGVAGILVATVGLLPLAFRAGDWWDRARVAGIPLAWLLLGFGVYPVLLGLAWFYVRRAERNEEAFSELVGTEAQRIEEDPR